MIEALTKSLGIVTNAVKVTGISRTTHYAWMEKDPEYRSRVEEATDAQIDFVEGNLIQRIQEGDTTATIFYLKTKGKKRGYTERMEIAPAEGTTMSFYQMLMMTGEANDDEEADES
nr:MAG TPA: putative terminase small subunit [Caudoviricetes sp.]